MDFGFMHVGLHLRKIKDSLVLDSQYTKERQGQNKRGKGYSFRYETRVKCQSRLDCFGFIEGDRLRRGRWLANHLLQGLGQISREYLLFSLVLAFSDGWSWNTR